MFESTPMYPDCGRYWDMVQRHKISVFYTAPTAIRSLMRFGDETPKKYNMSSLKVLGTVGEPINPGNCQLCFIHVLLRYIFDYLISHLLLRFFLRFSGMARK
jgi:acyl-coenzyme A synthetase/AMP-(fatty) acid ligase